MAEKLRVSIPFPQHNFTLELWQDGLYPKARRFYINTNLINDTQADAIVSIISTVSTVSKNPRYIKINRPKGESVYQFSFSLEKSSIKDENSIMDAVNHFLGGVLKDKVYKLTIYDIEKLSKGDVLTMVSGDKENIYTYVITDTGVDNQGDFYVYADFIFVNSSTNRKQDNILFSKHYFIEKLELQNNGWTASIKKGEEIKAEDKNILAVEMILHEVGKIVSYEEPYWMVKLSNDTTAPCYRSEIFVVGDVLEVTDKQNRSLKAKYKVAEIFNYNDKDIEDTISVYRFDESLQKFESYVSSITIKYLFKNTQVDVIQPFNLFELFDEPTLVPKEKAVETKPESTLSELDQAKKDLGQLLFIRSLISPIDFEEKITVNQVISEKQKKINELNFQEVEEKISEDKFFDDLFEQSFTPIKHEYDNVYSQPSEDAEFFTPSGERSKLSDDLNQVIRTPQFKEWFGDWELSYIYKDTDALEIECSKVITDDYEPKLVWHGTGKQFSYFIFDNFPAAYFAVNREYSQFFANLQGGDDGYVIPFFLNIRNPLDLTHFNTNKVKSKQFFDYIYLMTGLTMEELDVNPIFLSNDLPELETWMYIRNNPKMLKKISDTKLYDGIHFYETNPNIKNVNSPEHSTEAYIIFSADQCKIADPNRGNLLLASLKSFLLEKGGKI
jgi:hypothetical protein